jgi:hypothetical protein
MIRLFDTLQLLRWYRLLAVITAAVLCATVDSDVVGFDNLLSAASLLMKFSVQLAAA